MIDPTYPALVAVAFGVVVAIVFAVPFVSYHYRRYGRLTIPAAAVGFAVLVYLLALATYTLLPLPDPTVCSARTATPQLTPFRFVGDIARQLAARPPGVASVLRSTALLQVVFNVALFVPLGMIVRFFGRRSVIVTTLIGFGSSLLIETTQLTGDFFLYACPYRLFDVDDLFANTLGALAGAGLAPVLAILPSRANRDPGRPHPVSSLRRLVGMLCDWSIVVVGGLASTAVYLAIRAAWGAAPAPIDDLLKSRTLLLVALIELAVVVITGRTLGEAVVRLRPEPQGDTGQRLLRWLFGIGGYELLLSLPAFDGFAAAAFVVVSAVFVLTTRGHRGLASMVARLDVVDDRATADARSSLGGTRREGAAADRPDTGRRQSRHG